MSGTWGSPLGLLPLVTSHPTWADRLGGWRVRWGLGRMDYRVAQGLYALGRPGPDSPVLVSANYKLSFDALRRELAGLSAWLLVVDTHGVNVWCAAGKGNFGTQAVADQVKASALDRVVSHRLLILPQLCAPGVAAHQLHKLCGFKGVFGPVLARDLPAFLAAGCKATPEMRVKRFPLAERLVLAPMELVIALKHGGLAALALLLLAGLAGADYWSGLAGPGLRAALAVLTAILAGSVAGPAFLPWLPGKAFTAKGLHVGLVSGAIFWAAAWPGNWPEGVGLLCIIAAITAFLVMNFTGASTYTSLSGVKKEMAWGVPMEAALAVLGLALWLYGLFGA